MSSESSLRCPSNIRFFGWRVAFIVANLVGFMSPPRSRPPFRLHHGIQGWVPIRFSLSQDPIRRFRQMPPHRANRLLVTAAPSHALVETAHALVAHPLGDQDAPPCAGGRGRLVSRDLSGHALISQDKFGLWQHSSVLLLHKSHGCRMASESARVSMQRHSSMQERGEGLASWSEIGAP